MAPVTSPAASPRRPHLRRDPHPLPRAASSLVALAVLLSVVGAGATLAVSQIASGASQMTSGVQAGLDVITTWLSTGPLHVTGGQLSTYLTQAQGALSSHVSALSTGIIDVGSRTLELLAGTLICLIATFFYLFQGETIWAFTVTLLPRAARRPLVEATRCGWASLSAYSRTQVVVAAVDAIGIALGTLLLGLPLVEPILMLVFLCSFVPIVGVIVAGAVPTLIALVVNGPVSALIMLGVVLGGHDLFPELSQAPSHDALERATVR